MKSVKDQVDIKVSDNLIDYINYRVNFEVKVEVEDKLKSKVYNKISDTKWKVIDQLASLL